jgi:hypothetical protein
MSALTILQQPRIPPYDIGVIGSYSALLIRDSSVTESKSSRVQSRSATNPFGMMYMGKQYTQLSLEEEQAVHCVARKTERLAGQLICRGNQARGAERSVR